MGCQNITSAGMQLPVEEQMLWVLNKNVMNTFCLEPTPDLEEEASGL